jgi:hypothetical protein
VVVAYSPRHWQENTLFAPAFASEDTRLGRCEYEKRRTARKDALS